MTFNLDFYIVRDMAKKFEEIKGCFQQQKNNTLD